MSYLAAIGVIAGLWQFFTPNIAARSPWIGWGPWRSDWISICSSHYYHKHDCSRCRSGTWRNVTVGAIDHAIYVTYKPLWLYLHNDVARMVRKLRSDKNQGFPLDKLKD
ncbi:MAG: hypothetical protein EOP83_10910 [Verrucomicrobiaceae bacterium]|nr:MAG: hypothetical protein EOP83_10910 [Verrucomicrobiaceae bacterium]